MRFDNPAWTCGLWVRAAMAYVPRKYLKTPYPLTCHIPPPLDIEITSGSLLTAAVAYNLITHYSNVLIRETHIQGLGLSSILRVFSRSDKLLQSAKRAKKPATVKGPSRAPGLVATSRQRAALRAAASIPDLDPAIKAYINLYLQFPEHGSSSPGP